MIKKILHFLCFAVASILWMVLLAVFFRFVMAFVFKIDPLAQETYAGLVQYWNSGGILQGKDILMLLMLIAYFPLCCFGCFKLYHYKYLRLLTVPLNKVLNYGLDNYVTPDVNIKNLKIEEKKTLDQIVQERLNEEKKKNQEANQASSDFRKIIIEKINETKK